MRIAGVRAGAIAPKHVVLLLNPLHGVPTLHGNLRTPKRAHSVTTAMLPGSAAARTLRWEPSAAVTDSTCPSVRNASSDLQYHPAYCARASAGWRT